MSETMLIGAGAAVLVLLMLFAVISQRLEAARQARLRRGRILTGRIRRLWSLLTDLPPEVLGRELKLIIIQAAANDMNEYAALGNADAIRRQQAQLHDLAEKVQQQEETPGPTRFRNPRQAQAVRAQLRPLQTTVKAMLEGSQINRAVAQKFMARIAELNGETLFQIQVAEARRATNDFKPDLAVHKLTTCCTEIERINKDGRWDQHLNQLRQMISNVGQHGGLTPDEGAEIARIKAEQNIQEPGANSELAREMEKLRAEEESWKKRADFD